MSLLDNLLTFGFSPSEAKTYLALLEQGELSVGEISTRAELSRAGTHEALNAILSRGLVEVRREGRNTYYKSAHPNVLFGMLEEKKHEEERKQNEMTDTIRGLIGMFQVSESKPGVRFFEGMEAIRTTAFDSLRENVTEILTIHNLSIISTQYSDINDEYVLARRKKKIPSRILTLDTPQARAYQKEHPTDELTEIRLTNLEQGFENAVLKIYGNTISILTVHPNSIIGIIIEHPHIAEMHHALFTQLWTLAAQQAPLASAT